MIDLVREAASLQKLLEDNRFRFYFIGGIAVQVWGEPRLTRDVDVSVFTELTDENKKIEFLLKHYQAKFSGAAEFAFANRVLPVIAPSGIEIDIQLSGIADLNETLTRSSYEAFTPDIALNVCSASDLIALKTIAARPKDWIDIESVVIKQTDLDWKYIEGFILELEGYDDITEKLERLRQLKKEFYRK